MHAVGGVVLAVTGGHAALGPQHLGALGAAGVDLFFVISGAIMYLTAFERPASPIAFLGRRLVRVAPLYWLVTLAFVAGAAVFGRTYAEPLTLASAATTLTFWPAWSALTPPPLGVGWTLCFEMLFYAGVALALASRRWLLVLFTAYAAMWALRVGTGWAPARFLGNPIILEFLFGVLLMRYRRRLSLAPQLAVGALALGLVLLILPNAPDGIGWAPDTFSGRESFARVLLYGVPAALIAWAALGLEPVLRRAAVLIYLGDASYSLYLAHTLVFGLLIGALRGVAIAPDALLLGSLVAAVVSGCVLYELVEKPLLAFLRPRPAAALRQAA